MSDERPSVASPEPDEGRARTRSGKRADPPAGWFDLLADLERPGCPACHAARRTASRVLEAIFVEAVTDPGVRARLRASHGFCTDHALQALQRCAQQADGHAIAVLYRDVLAHVEKKARRAARRARRWRLWPSRPGMAARMLAAEQACSVCEAADHRAEVYLGLLASAEPASELGRAARGRDRGVCLRHLEQGLRTLRHRRQAEHLVQLFARGAGELRGDLDEYLDDLSRGTELGDRQGGSWQRATLWTTGRPAHRYWWPRE